MFAAAIGIDHLCLFNWRQSRESKGLGFAPLENRRTVGTRENADFAGDRSQILVSAAIHAFAFLQNADAKGFFLHVIEGLRDREAVRFRIFLHDRFLHFFAKSLDSFCPRHFAFGVKRTFDPVARHLIRDVE